MFNTHKEIIMYSNFKRILLQVFLLTWLIVVTILFIVVNRFSNLQIFSDWSAITDSLHHIQFVKFALDLLIAFLGITIFTVAATSLGLRILKSLQVPETNVYAKIGTAFLIGEIFFSILWLTVIVIFQLHSWFIALSILFGFLLSFSLFNTNNAFRFRFPLKKFSQNERLILVLVSILFLLTLLYSSARLGYDAVAEYFSHAKIMAITGKSIFFYPNDSFVVSSFHPGILYTGIIQLFGDQSARMLSWVSGFAIILIIFALNNNAGLSHRVNLFFLILLFTSTAFIDLLGDGKVEIITTASILVSVYWMTVSLKYDQKEVFLLIGALGGFAIISRPYNIFLVSGFVATFYFINLVSSYRSHGHKKYLKFITNTKWYWMFPTLIGFGIFHIWQNQIWLGSPIAPLIYARQLSASDWQWQFDQDLLNIFRILYPFTVTFLNSPQSLGTISPFFIISLLFLLFQPIRKNINLPVQYKHLLQASLFVLLIWITFFFTVVEIRYVLFIWIIILLGTALLLESIFQNISSLIRSSLNFCIVIALIFLGARTIAISIVGYSPILSTGQPVCRDLVFCSFLDPINDTASAGDRVLVLNAYRYYLRLDLFSCSTRTEEYANFQSLAKNDPQNFWVEVYKHGYKFIAFEKNFSTFHSRFGTLPDISQAPPWMQINMISSSLEDNVIAYQIDTINPPISQEVVCKQDAKGIWQVEPLDNN